MMPITSTSSIQAQAASPVGQDRGWIDPDKGSERWHDWLHDHQDALFDWCRAHAPPARLGADEFTAAAMAVQRQAGSPALSEWLLWAAVMLARGAPSRATDDGARALPPLLQRLLTLAQAERLHSPDVQALLAGPADEAPARIAHLERQAKAWASPRGDAA